MHDNQCIGAVVLLAFVNLQLDLAFQGQVRHYFIKKLKRVSVRTI
jgi:hypothetical protein